MVKNVLVFIFIIFSSCNPSGKKTYLFAGSFTDKKPSNGIVVFEMNPNSGELTKVFQVDSIINPSFLKIDPSGKYLYACTESQMKKNGKIAAFKIDSFSGKLSLLNVQDSGGRNPAHISINSNGNILVASNYTDPSLAVFKVKEDGRLDAYQQLLKFVDSSVVKGRQDEAHIHSSNFSRDEKMLFAQDLGADKIRAFRVGVKDDLLIESTPKFVKTNLGAGPRHFTFHPNGRYGYGIEELSGNISFYTYQNNKLEFKRSYLSYSNHQEIYRAADIHISPDGQFLYASNRGPDEDSISIFFIEKNGHLKLVDHVSTHGQHPRNFAIDPSGKFLIVANQFTDNIIVFRRNKDSGTLKKLSNDIVMDNPSSIQIYTYHD